MKFCWTTLHVTDMEKSLHFYQVITGLPLNRRFTPAPGRDIAFLGEGTTELELILDDQRQIPATSISIGFIVPTTLEDTMMQLREHGYHHISEVQAPGPQVRFFYAGDPDGFQVQFVEVVKG